MDKGHEALLEYHKKTTEQIRDFQKQGYNPLDARMSHLSHVSLKMLRSYFTIVKGVEEIHTPKGVFADEFVHKSLQLAYTHEAPSFLKFEIIVIYCFQFEILLKQMLAAKGESFDSTVDMSVRKLYEEAGQEIGWTETECEKNYKHHKFMVTYRNAIHNGGLSLKKHKPLRFEGSYITHFLKKGTQIPNIGLHATVELIQQTFEKTLMPLWEAYGTDLIPETITAQQPCPNQKPNQTTQA